MIAPIKISTAQTRCSDAAAHAAVDKEMYHATHKHAAYQHSALDAAGYK